MFDAESMAHNWCTVVAASVWSDSEKLVHAVSQHDCKVHVLQVAVMLCAANHC